LLAGNDPIAVQHRGIDHADASRWFADTLPNWRSRLWILEDVQRGAVAVGDATSDGTLYEAALLVVDAWQRKGLGTRLLGQILIDLRGEAVTTVRVTTRIERLPVINHMKRRLGLTTTCIASNGEAEVLIHTG
jgi:GNAT superfamily N-acetyltransferase